jgi:hypothetical protein
MLSFWFSLVSSPPLLIFLDQAPNSLLNQLLNQVPSLERPPLLHPLLCLTFYMGEEHGLVGWRLAWGPWSLRDVYSTVCQCRKAYLRMLFFVPAKGFILPSPASPRHPTRRQKSPCNQCRLQGVSLRKLVRIPLLYPAELWDMTATQLERSKKVSPGVQSQPSASE